MLLPVFSIQRGRPTWIRRMVAQFWPDIIKQFEYGGYIGSTQVPIDVISYDK